MQKNAKTNELDPNEIQEAFILWNRQVQLECFQKKIEYMKSDKPIDISRHIIYQLSLLTDKEGVTQ